MIELPDDAEYQRLTRAAERPRRVRSGARTVPAAWSEPVSVPVTRSGVVGVVRAPVVPPVDTSPPPGWEPSPESRAAMDELLPPKRPETEPSASAGAAPLTVADAIPALRRVLADDSASATDIAAAVRALVQISERPAGRADTRTAVELSRAELLAIIAEERAKMGAV